MSDAPTPGDRPAREPGDVGPAEAAPDHVQRAQRDRLARAWAFPTGWRYFSSPANVRVGMWYMVASFGFFLFAGVLALMMRVQLAGPNVEFLDASTYNQIVTMHGTAMMFLFGVPILEAFSIYMLPAMLGARDLPFPRLSAFGFWCFLIGGVFVCGSIFFGVGPEGGWFMYPPLTTAFQPGVGADIWLLGLTFVEIAAIAAVVEIIVAVLKSRPPGMRLNLIPLYAWYILVVAGMILFAFPPLIAGDILLECERAFDWPFFDPARGGDPILWQHLFWVFGHPEVYIIFLPSIALVAMIVPTFARTPIVGYGWVVLAAVGTGFISFGLWVHHMFTTGLPGISLGLFSAASEAVAIPTSIQIFCFIATLVAGHVVRRAAVLFVFGGIATFIIGGLTGVMVAIAPFDLQAHDTHFVVAHLHYVLIGGAVFPIMAGVYYYYPLVASRLLSERLGTIAFWLMFAGLNVAFLPMHITGLRGLPRRVFTYETGLGFDTLNLVSTVGAFLLAAGIGVVVWDVMRPKKRDPAPARNPWNAGTLEWISEIPSQPWSARCIPEIDSRYPLWDQPGIIRDYDDGRFYLPDAEEGKREMLITSVIDAKPMHCQRVGGPSFLPLLAATFIGFAFIFSTFKLVWLALACAVLGTVFVLIWLWTGTAQIPEKEEKDVGLGLTLPLYVSGPNSVGWWGMLITMLGDLTAYVSLVFGYFFYWTVHEDFPPRDLPDPGVFWPLVGGGLLVGAWLCTLAARRCNRTDQGLLFYGAGLIGAVLAMVGSAALALGPWRAGMDPQQHVYPAIVWVLILWTILHAGVGALMQLYCIARRAAGKMTTRYNADIANVTVYWHFCALTAVMTVAVVAGFPLVAG